MWASLAFASIHLSHGMTDRRQESRSRRVIVRIVIALAGSVPSDMALVRSALTSWMALMPRANRWMVILRAVLASAAIFGFLETQSVSAQDEDYDPVIVISMGDHFFEVLGMESDTPIKVKAGRVYFLQIRNDGKQEHNVEWGREVLTKDRVPEVYATH